MAQVPGAIDGAGGAAGKATQNTLVLHGKQLLAGDPHQHPNLNSDGQSCPLRPSCAPACNLTCAYLTHPTITLSMQVSSINEQSQAPARRWHLATAGGVTPSQPVYCLLAHTLYCLLSSPQPSGGATPACSAVAHSCCSAALSARLIMAATMVKRLTLVSWCSASTT